MLNQTVTTVKTILASSMMTETIESRFGTIVVDTDKSIFLSQGMLGIPGKFNFVIAPFPNPKMAQFTVLQCLDDLSTSFITLPLAIDNSIISAEDLRTACHELQIPEEQVAILLVVNVLRSPDKVRLAVNARAPLIINVEQRTGEQYVFQHERYALQHML